jgi:hypothetical protein
MTKPHRLPLGQQGGRVLRHRAKQSQGRMGCIDLSESQFVAAKIEQTGQVCPLAEARKMLKMTEAQKARGDPCHHGRRFDGLAPYLGGRGDQCQGAGGGNAQRMHGLRAQKFPYARAQYGPAVAAPGIGRGTGAFELDFHRAHRGLDLTHPQCPAVAELPGPDPELMSTVDAGQGFAARPGLVAGQNIQHAGLKSPMCWPAQIVGERIRPCHPARFWQGSGLPGGRKCRPQAGKTVEPDGRGMHPVYRLHVRHCLTIAQSLSMAWRHWGKIGTNQIGGLPCWD